MTDMLKKILKDARELIEDRKHWIKGVHARDYRGRPVLIDSPTACSFCSVGAISRAAQNNKIDRMSEVNQKAFRLITSKILSAHHYSTIVQFNDSATTTHDMVLSVFDQVIETL